MKKILMLMCAVSLLGLNACLVAKKVVYVKDMSLDTAYRTLAIPPLKIQKSDRLSILVSSKNQELAAPFNAESGLYSVSERGAINTLENNLVGKGYLVDQSGNIEFPILGTINVMGKTLDEVKEQIKGTLINNKLINAPIVKVELLNLKVMMMGEVSSVGVVDVPDGRITLLEAITRSGGLTTNAKEDEIMVIREENNERKMYINNIEDVNIFNSPTYYLQQNDVVYVRPKAAKLSEREQSSWRYIGMFTALISLGVSMVAIFAK